ncbi:expressed unknown protein [Seminavis robusta]|uniref:Uncharacterized protein n=1 Tax=Seminavis robusta TaxID=568900 RepID=A0A9N8EKT2_9STRA|nr:expressed unknown protein [Seminavis robusta]|eukprot:Sro1247_g255860.1 n/a (304) ;mRNA; f:5355-6266
METTTKPCKGQVKVRHYQKLDPASIDMKQWPTGKEIQDALKKEGFLHRLETKEEAFWQAAFRWALLKKYGHCPQGLENPFAETPDRSTQKLCLSDQDIVTIDDIWQELCELATSDSAKNHSEADSDLLQFLATAMSNRRQLQWSFMDCGPACQFKLHAHPNMEIIFCVKGELHEIRMDGKPITKEFESEETSSPDSDIHSNQRLKGPDLSLLGRPWKFQTLKEGNFLVNEVGSIHKSFAATNGEGVLLLVVWGGSHADVSPDQEPRSVNVQEALETMDKRLCGDCASGTLISETFLPTSERSQ